MGREAPDRVSSNVAALSEVRPQPAKDLIVLLEELLEAARSGEIIRLSGIVEYARGGTFVLVKTSCPDRFIQIGALRILEAKLIAGMADA